MKAELCAAQGQRRSWPRLKGVQGSHVRRPGRDFVTSPSRVWVDRRSTRVPAPLPPAVPPHTRCLCAGVVLRA